MDKKDKIELCLKQAELGAARWDRRRNDEWKVTLLFWAGLLASAKFLREAQVSVPFKWLVIGLIGFLLLYTFVWLRGLWVANHNDKEWEIFYRLEAAKLLCTNGDGAISAPPSKTTPPLREFLTNYSMIFQALMTTLVTIAALIIIASTPVEKKKPNQQQGDKQATAVTLPANPSP